MQHRRLNLFFLIALCWVVSPLHASPQDAQAWLEQWIEDARGFELPTGVYIELEQFEPLHLTEDEQASVRARDELLSKEDRLYRDKVHEANGERIRYRLWYESPVRWRVCRDKLMRSGRSSYTDGASNADGSWILLPDRLHLIGPDGTPQDNKSVSASMSLTAMRLIVHQMATGIHPSPQLEYTPIQTAENGDGTFTCVAELDRTGLESVAFTLDPHGSGSDGYDIRRARLNKEEPPDPTKPAVGMLKTFNEWRWSDAMGSRVAHVFTDYSHDIPYRIYTIVSIRPLQGPIDDLVQPPEAPDGTDPIRGDLAISRVMDHESGDALWYDTNSGEVIERSKIRVAEQKSLSLTPFVGVIFVSGLIVIASGFVKRKGV